MRKIILFYLMVSIVAGCAKALEEVPKDFISSANFYKNVQEIEDGLVAAYTSMWLAPEGNQWKNFIALHSDYGTAAGSFTSIGNWDVLLQPDTYSRVNRFWLGFYEQVNRANIILTKAPLVKEMDENTRSRILGEAHFLRAQAYFNLVRYWGPVPLREEEFTGATPLGAPRVPIDEVYDFIIADLLIAEKDCPENVGNNTGRASNWAAKVLLAEVYLGKEDWAKAAEKADEVIMSNQFSLVSVNKSDDFFQIFATTTTSSEEIMAFHFSSNLLPTFQQWYHGVGSPYNTGVTYGFTNYPRMSSPFIINWDEKDLRKNFNLYSYFINSNGDTVYLTGITTRFKKYIKNPDGDALYNIPIYRLADAYLIYAEGSCMAEGSPSSLALERLNIIRRRAYGYDPHSSTPIDYQSGMSKDEFRTAVIQERGYEFFNEYSRWWDLKRTGTAKALISAATGKSFNDFRLLFPIPAVEIQNNPDISESDQNPGY